LRRIHDPIFIKTGDLGFSSNTLILQ
jgi:hypothetical protein